MRPSTTARRYAEAAFQVAQQDGNVADWLRYLEEASDVLREQQIALYFKDPKHGTQQKLEKLDEVFGNYPEHVLNLMRVLIVNQRLGLLPQIAGEFSALDREARGVVDADVTVARPMTDDERAQIEKRLEAVTGKQVELYPHVDPRILGGIVIRIGDRLIDASVAGRLQRLRQELAV